MKTEITEVKEKAVLGWVGYDALCPVCRSLERRWHPILGPRGFPFVPLQEPWLAARIGFSPEERQTEMKLLLADGRVMGGAGACLYLGLQIGWLAPFAWIAGLPPFRWGVDRVYRWIAANRYCLGDVCRVPTPAPTADPNPGPATHRKGNRRSHTTAFFESP